MNHRTLKPVRLIPIATTILMAVALLSPTSQSSPASRAAQDGANPMGGLSAENTAFHPTTPPDARKISVGDPDLAGYALINGESGAVPPDASVIIINLSAHNLITATAATDGSFQALLFAPPGSSLLVKYEENGSRIYSFWQKAVTAVADTEVLNPLPGTTLYVGGPEPSAGKTQSFHAVGADSSLEPPKRWAGWFMSGELTIPEPAQLAAPQQWEMSVLPGEVVTLTLELRATSPAMNCSSLPMPDPVIQIELRELFGPNGAAKPWDIWFDAFLFTPTGLPIEHEGYVEPFDAGEPQHFTNLTCLSEGVLAGELQTTFTIPLDVPEGYYRPEFYFLPSIPLSDEVPQAVVWLHDSNFVRGLPILRVGNAAPPRIPWELFANELVNGQRGVMAVQDTGSHAMVNRVTTVSPLPVFPAIDERSGQAIVYHLEPGSTWLSNTDRRLPTPPHIPLLLPSGELEIKIQQPDGTLQTLGPAPIQGSLVRTPSLPGGSDFAEGTGQLGDLYHLYNFEDVFAHSFEQQGLHTISLHGVVQDVFGNPYSLESTYEVMVAHVLDLDPNILPTTPFVAGNSFPTGVHIFPPVPAQVNITLTHLPNSDPAQAQVMEIGGQANRAGYFQAAPADGFILESQGEFRVDISAEYHTPDGEVWFGSMTWGGVVERLNPSLAAHGRRGMDYKSETIDDMPIWFRNQDLPSEKVGIENYYPYFSGDIHWGDETPEQPYLGDSIHSILTFEDLTPEKTFYDLLRDRYPRATNGFRWPPVDTSITGLEKRIAINEAPLFITTESGVHPELRPEEIDLWGYWYGSSQRPDVRVRELISEDNMGTAYWRFNDTYNYQLGEPAVGDHPGDIKWEFGGVVLRTTSEISPVHEYAIYSSLWVLLPQGCDAFGCTRVTPPFRGAGTLNGGPILTLLGEDIDMLFLPKCIRPGDILNMENTIAFCGHVGPPLDSRVDVTITSPSGVEYSRSGHANKIGWLYDPSFDFLANEVGRWSVDVFVEHDRPYLPTGITPTEYNTGTVLGTQGQYEFYVVEPDSPGLYLSSPQPGFITWSSGVIEPIHILGNVSPGTEGLYFTIHDKGMVMGQGVLAPDASGAFDLVYDAKALHEDFPMLSLTAHEGRWEGLADEVTISLLATGSGMPRAGRVTLIGEQVFVESDASETGSKVFIPLVRR